MKRKITFIILFAILAIWGSCLQAIVVTPTGTHYIGDRLTFRPTNSSFGNVAGADWDFGDGDTATVTYGMDSVTHSYKMAGEYVVTVIGNVVSGSPITETVTVRIEPPQGSRYISVSPTSPIAGQPATFTAFNFVTPEAVAWDMGDGTILSTGSRKSRFRERSPFGGAWPIRRSTRRANSRNLRGIPNIRGTQMTRRPDRPTAGSTVSHTYSQPGTYTVRAYDWNGDRNSTPITFRVTVGMPARAITFSPTAPVAGMPVQFNAVNFLSSLIDWDFGDGTTQSGGSISVTHVYNNAGTFTVTARERDSNFGPVSVTVIVTQPNRTISFQPQAPRVDQTVFFQASNFLTKSIDWNMGDGTIINSASESVTHRYTNPGIYTVSAKDSSINHTPVTTTVSVLEENRYITVSPLEARTNQPVTAQAFNFRGDFILWDFGDGTQITGGHSETHVYERAGTYTIIARDENGESGKSFTTQVTIKGIDDRLNLEIAEIKWSNGKYYRVVPMNMKGLYSVLRLKMAGAGTITGYWTVDGHPFEFFNDVISEGETKEIRMKKIGGVPTISPGMHLVNIVITRPTTINVQFPVLKYFVMAHEVSFKTHAPLDGYIAKENEIPVFSWESARGASKYQVAFSNYLYPILTGEYGLKWIDVETSLKYQPGVNTWRKIKRNKWTYWKVRALDNNGNVVAETDVMNIKVVIANAKISIDNITDLSHKDISFAGGSVSSNTDDILVQGRVQYMGDSKFLVLRVFVDNELIDQLLFRDVKKAEIRHFETSVPNNKRHSRISFQVLKTSSPAVIVGIKNLDLWK